MTSEPSYELLYELSGEWLLDPRWLIAGAVALAAVLVAGQRRARRGRPAGVAGFLAGALALMLAALAGSAWEEREAARALHAGRVAVAEGELRDLEIRPRTRYNPRTNSHERSVSEAFRVGDVAFGYVRGVSAPGFNNGGDPPLRLAVGDRLRVHYVRGEADDFEHRRIVRLERRAGPRPADPASGAMTLAIPRP